MVIHIRRREFIVTLGSAATWPLGARAQQGGKKYTIGIFSANNKTEVIAALNAAFFEALRELGWVEGKSDSRSMLLRQLELSPH